MIFSNSHIPHSDRITDNHPNNFVFVVSYWWDVAARHNHHPILWILKAILKHPHFCHCNLSGVNKNANVAFEGLPLQKTNMLWPSSRKKRKETRPDAFKKSIFSSHNKLRFPSWTTDFFGHLEREQRSWKTIQPGLEATPHNRFSWTRQDEAGKLGPF